jgi:hypothetical protein
MCKKINIRWLSMTDSSLVGNYDTRTEVICITTNNNKSHGVRDQVNSLIHQLGADQQSLKRGLASLV